MTTESAIAHADLTPTQADVIRRYYLQGHLLRHIATDMGCTEGWVSKIKTSAEKKLGIVPVRKPGPGRPRKPGGTTRTEDTLNRLARKFGNLSRSQLLDKLEKLT